MPQTACMRAVDGENAGQRALGHLDVHTHRGSDSVPAAAGASSFSSTASPRGGSTFSSSPDMVLSVLSNYDWILSRSMRSQLSPTSHLHEETDFEDSSIVTNPHTKCGARRRWCACYACSAERRSGTFLHYQTRFAQYMFLHVSSYSSSSSGSLLSTLKIATRQKSRGVDCDRANLELTNMQGDKGRVKLRVVSSYIRT